MGLRYILDTNALLYLTRGESSIDFKSGIYFYSIITRIELLSYSKITFPEEQAITRLLEQLNQVRLTDSIAAQAITLRRQHRLKIPDAIIAATALVLNAELITNDKALLGLPGVLGRTVRSAP